MKKKVSVSWFFEKDESDAPIKVRIGLVRKGQLGHPISWKKVFAFVWGAAILYVLIYLFRLLV